jgi:hypothetical protein
MMIFLLPASETAKLLAIMLAVAFGKICKTAIVIKLLAVYAQAYSSAAEKLPLAA